MATLRVIAIVEDDESVRRALSSLMRSSGYAVHTYSCAEDFLGSLYFHVTECLITDFNLPVMNGADLFLHVREKGAQLPVILISGRLDNPLIDRANFAGAFDVLRKPFFGADLLDLVQAGLGRGRVGRNAQLCR